MVVVGIHSYILNYTGRTTEVSPFTSSYKSLKNVPLVDTIIVYDFPFHGKTYLLVCHNVLFVSSMTHNLIPLFILRETNIMVNDVPIIQIPNPDETTHSIWFLDSVFRITLSLRAIFSYSLTRNPTIEELVYTEDILVMTPQGQNWDPNSDVYTQNEENMTDWEGNMVEPHHCVLIIIEYLPEVDNAMVASAVISASKSNLIDNKIKNTKPIANPLGFDECMIAKNSCDNIHFVLSSILSIYHPVQLHDKQLERRNIRVFAASIGLETFGSTSPYVSDVVSVNSDNESDSEIDDNATITEWNQELFDNMDIDLDALISSVGATTASKPTGFTAKHLSKVW